MCGRFAINNQWKDIVDFFHLQGEPEPLQSPRYNVAPGQQVLVLRLASDGSRYISLLRWGLIPTWAKDEKVGHKLINARSETAAEKPSFRAALQARRGIVPVSGFYEWKKAGKGRVPHFIRLKNGDPMALAALWERWKSPGGDTIESCTILTTEANAAVSQLHDRMPVMLHPSEFDQWLARDAVEPGALSFLFRPYPAELMEVFPVSPLVNSVANDRPECLVPL